MFLTIKELAAILRVDHKTIRNAIRDGRIEAVRVGRAFRIPSAAIDALAASWRGGKKSR
jgi:excisionase family DNA binding protein